jgi:hypothetical protein
MTKSSIALDVIDVARPCPADWNEMRGDDRVRFCRHCSLHVYNLSAMSHDEAEQLVNEHEGRLCVRFYRRLDGTVITQDCRGGWRLAARRLGAMATALAAVALAVLSVERAVAGEAGANDVTNDPARCALMGSLAMPPATQPAPPKVMQGEVVMGKMSPPPTTQPHNPATRPSE